MKRRVSNLLEPRLIEVTEQTLLMPQRLIRTSNHHRDGLKQKSKIIWHQSSERPMKTVCGLDFLEFEMPLMLGAVKRLCPDCNITEDQKARATAILTA